jgi:hypothetical protein
MTLFINQSRIYPNRDRGTYTIIGSNLFQPSKRLCVAPMKSMCLRTNTMVSHKISAKKRFVLGALKVDIMDISTET